MITLDGKLICNEYESPCDVCGMPVDKDCWTVIGGDGYGGRCCGEADVPTISECEWCGTEYCLGERSYKEYY